MSFGKVSCAATEKLSTKVAVDTSKGVDNVYSLTLSPDTPIIYIFVPSLLNDMPRGEFSCVPI